MRTRVIAGFFCVLALLCFQSVAQNPSAQDQGDEKISVGTSEVVVDAVVKDKKGRPVKDLKASDFEVYEDGVRQQVQSFRFVTNAPAAPGDNNSSESPAKKSPDSAVPNRPAALPGVTALALVFDRLSQDARSRARVAALSYVDKELVAGDFIGVFAVDLSLHVVQSFTRDRQLVRQAIDKATSSSPASFVSGAEELRTLNERQASLDNSISSSTPGSGGGGDGVALATSKAEQALNQMAIQTLSTFERLERDQQGYATTNGLLAVVNAMRSLEGRKAMIFFSEGMAIPPAVQSFFRSVISNANRANVSVYAVDAAGLRVESPNLETQREIQSLGSRRQRQMASGKEDTSGQPMSRELERNEDLLRLNPESGLGQLADETGGFLVSGTNDPGAKLRQVNEDLHSYYLLTYVPSNKNYDGRFRQIGLKLNHTGLELQARKGYYAINAVDASPVLAYEAPALAALGGGIPVASLPLYAGGFAFPEVSRPTRVSVLVEVPAGTVTYSPDKARQNYRTDFSVIALIRDESRRVVRKLSNQYQLTGPLDHMETDKRSPILFYREADLEPGHYTIAVAAYDAIAGKAMVVQSSLEVVGIEANKVRLSTLSILKRGEQLSAEDKKKDTPFNYGEVLVYPNLGEPLQLSAVKQLAFFVTAYVTPASKAALTLTLSIAQQGRILKRASVSLPAPDASGRIPYANALPIDKMQPGKYELMATVSDGVSSATRSTSFVLQ